MCLLDTQPLSLMEQFAPLRLISDGKLWGKSYYKWRDRYGHPLNKYGHQWGIKPDCVEQLKEDALKYTHVM